MVAVLLGYQQGFRPCKWMPLAKYEQLQTEGNPNSRGWGTHAIRLHTLTTWLLWDLGKLQFWYRHCEQQMFLNWTYSGLFFFMHPSSLLFPSFQYLNPILHNHTVKRYTPQISHSGFRILFFILFLSSSPTNLIADLSPAALLSSKFSFFFYSHDLCTVLVQWSLSPSLTINLQLLFYPSTNLFHWTSMYNLNLLFMPMKQLSPFILVEKDF